MRISIFIIIMLFVQSCQSVKEGLSSQKKKNSDEFLVEKKSPLVLPPDYGELPVPNEQIKSIGQKDEISFNEILKENKLKKIEKQNQNNQNSIEKSILDKIK